MYLVIKLWKIQFDVIIFSAKFSILLIIRKSSCFKNKRLCHRANLWVHSLIFESHIFKISRLNNWKNIHFYKTRETITNIKNYIWSNLACWRYFRVSVKYTCYQKCTDIMKFMLDFSYVLPELRSRSDEKWKNHIASQERIFQICIRLI